VYLHIICPHVIYSSAAHNKYIRATGGVRTHNLTKRETADPRFRQLIHWEFSILSFFFIRTSFFVLIVLAHTYVLTTHNKHIHAPSGIFLFFCSVFVLYPFLFLRHDCPAF
jgi:hypothetical protein